MGRHEGGGPIQSTKDVEGTLPGSWSTAPPGSPLPLSNKKMNKEKQRIAIAEACGWTTGHCPCGEEQCGAWQNPRKDNWEYLPDYLADLNAMHEAEETLTEHEWNQMFEWLIHIRWRDANATERYSIGKQKALSPSRATSAQRAEAFLRALGKWAID